jgi:hypothetical protein
LTAILHGEGVTPLGIYLLARSYHQAADTVANDHKNALPDPPARLLYLHAAETYLRCFLRTKGVTPQSLRKFNHQLGNMLDEATALGLSTSVKVTKYLQSATAENDYVRARYDINVRSRSWPPSKGGEINCSRCASRSVARSANFDRGRVVEFDRGRVVKNGCRPPAQGHDPVTAIRLSPEIRETVDQWAAQQPDKPSRSEAIRRLVELGLKAKGK